MRLVLTPLALFFKEKRNKTRCWDNSKEKGPYYYAPHIINGLTESCQPNLNSPSTCVKRVSPKKCLLT